MSTRNRQLCVEELEGRIVPSSLVYSNNWSGYAAVTNLSSPQPNSVSAVYGNWVVPTVTGSSNAYSVVWVGIDGYSSRSVEQIGTEQDTKQGGGTFYRAWYEMYPAPAVTVPITVSPGDGISASVVYDSTQQGFILSIADTTTGNSFSTTQTLTSAQRSSAEWVVEAPLATFGKVLPLANFGHVDFSGASATINGVTGPVDNATWQNTAINMVSKHTVIAATSALTDTAGTSGFTVSYTGTSFASRQGGGGQAGNGPNLPAATLAAVPSLSAALAMAVATVPSVPAQQSMPVAVTTTFPSPLAVPSNTVPPAPEPRMPAVVSHAAFAPSDRDAAAPNVGRAATWIQTPAADNAARPESGTAPDAAQSDVSVPAPASNFASSLLADAEAGSLAPAARPTLDTASAAGLALLVLGLDLGYAPEAPPQRSRRSRRPGSQRGA